MFIQALQRSHQAHLFRHVGKSLKEMGFSNPIYKSICYWLIDSDFHVTFPTFVVCLCQTL